MRPFAILLASNRDPAPRGWLVGKEHGNWLCVRAPTVIIEPALANRGVIKTTSARDPDEHLRYLSLEDISATKHRWLREI